MNKELILGALLGDASINELSKRVKTHVLSWEHSDAQEKYALWKAVNLGVSFSVYKRARLDKRTNKIYKSVTVYTTGKNDFIYYKNLFYPKGTKEINSEILSMLNPLSIAIWFCDDGNLYYNGHNCHLTLSVDCFDSELIIKYFFDTWGLLFKKAQKRIRLTSVAEIRKFEVLFKPFYPPMMEYKTLDYQKNKHNNTLSNEQKKSRNKKYL